MTPKKESRFGDPFSIFTPYHGFWAVTKSGTGTWNSGRGDLGLGRGDLGRGTWKRGDVGTRGLGEVGREDVGTRIRAGIRGRDKQITPDFCAELVKYTF